MAEPRWAEAQLRAAGVPRPVTILWFSTPRAAYGVIFYTLVALVGAGFLWSFHVNPDQEIHGRGAWMTVGHGMGGFLFGLLILGMALALGYRMAWRLCTRQSAFAITPRGVLTARPFAGAQLMAWDAIDCVKVERNYQPSRIWFVKPRMYATLALYPVAPAGHPAKPVKLDAMHIEGGLFRTCRFADTLERTLNLIRAGTLRLRS